ncbi:MAG TPA: hypothetical protein VER58_21935 [Thermoanaerobaculia bacterium]|nr:hypothetical protein [Thermoanaerobaculia bacterium]
MLLAVSIPATTHVNTSCGFSFEYPKTWTAIENPDAAVRDPARYSRGLAKCAVGLRPPGWATERRKSPFVLAAYPVRVVRWNKTFVQAAKDAFFVRVGDLATDERPSNLNDLQPTDWGIFVRQGIEPATQFKTACCQGVRGTSWGHDQAKDGSTVTIFWEGAVVNDRHGHSLVIESDDNDRFKSVVDMIIDTARFATQ